MRILIIDDDQDDRMLFSEALQEVDPQVVLHAAVSGESALTWLNTEAADLILLDVNMPVMNGWNCLEKFKNHPRFKNIPVVMYSTCCTKRDVEKAELHGAALFLCKPNQFTELIQSMKEVLTLINHDHADSPKDSKH